MVVFQTHAQAATRLLVPLYKTALLRRPGTATSIEAQGHTLRPNTMDPTTTLFTFML